DRAHCVSGSAYGSTSRDTAGAIRRTRPPGSSRTIWWRTCSSTWTRCGRADGRGDAPDRFMTYPTVLGRVFRGRERIIGQEQDAAGLADLVCELADGARTRGVSRDVADVHGVNASAVAV